MAACCRKALSLAGPHLVQQLAREWFHSWGQHKSCGCDLATGWCLWAGTSLVAFQVCDLVVKRGGGAATVGVSGTEERRFGGGSAPREAGVITVVLY